MLLYLLVFASLFVSICLCNCMKTKSQTTKSSKSKQTVNRTSSSVLSKESKLDRTQTPDSPKPTLAVKSVCPETQKTEPQTEKTVDKKTETKELKQSTMGASTDQPTTTSVGDDKENQDKQTMFGVSELPSGSGKSPSLKVKTQERSKKSNKFKKAMRKKTKSKKAGPEDDPTLVHSSKFPSDVIDGEEKNE